MMRNTRNKMVLSACCMILCALLLTACAAGIPQANETTAPATVETTSPQPTGTEPAKVNVADYGLTFSISDELKDLMLVEATGTVYGGSTELYRFREKESVEQWIGDHGEDNGYVGGLYCLEVRTQEQFNEGKQVLDHGEYFAKDEEKGLYYCFTFFGGSQDYRTGGDTSHWTDESWRDMYESLSTSYTTLAEQIIQNKGLTPFTNEEAE